MKVEKCSLPGLKLIIPDLFEDKRGFFFESYSRQKLEKHGINMEFVQDNHSKSKRGTLRGLHYQLNPGQDKLVRVIAGKVFDVAVDLRKDSPTFGRWDSVVLSSENKKMFFIPKGFAHGFYVMSETAEFVYKCSEYYSPEDERGIIWNDSKIAIDWPEKDLEKLTISEKDKKYSPLENISEKDLF